MPPLPPLSSLSVHLTFPRRYCAPPAPAGRLKGYRSGHTSRGVTCEAWQKEAAAAVAVVAAAAASAGAVEGAKAVVKRPQLKRPWIRLLQQR